MRYYLAMFSYSLRINLIAFPWFISIAFLLFALIYLELTWLKSSSRKKSRMQKNLNRYRQLSCKNVFYFLLHIVKCGCWLLCYIKKCASNIASINIASFLHCPIFCINNCKQFSWFLCVLSWKKKSIRISNLIRFQNYFLPHLTWLKFLEVILENFHCTYDSHVMNVLRPLITLLNCNSLIMYLRGKETSPSTMTTSWTLEKKGEWRNSTSSFDLQLRRWDF